MHKKPTTPFLGPPILSNVAAEEALMAAVLAHEDVLTTVHGLVTPDDFTNTRLRVIAKAAWSCLASTPPRASDLSAVWYELQRAGLTDASASFSVPYDYLQAVDDKGTGQAIRNAPANAALVHRIAQGRRISETLRHAADEVLSDPDGLDELIQTTTTTLFKEVQDVRGELPADATSILARIKSAMDAGPAPVMSTGFGWLDSVGAAFSPGDICLLLGQYKNRKTTVAMHMISSALQQGKRVMVFSVDDSQEMFLKQLVSVRATHILRQRGAHELDHVLSAKFFDIPQSRWSKQQTSAIWQAWEGVEKLGSQLMIYDTGHYPIRTFSNMQRIVEHQCKMQKVDMLVVDHLQGIHHTTDKALSTSHERFTTMVDMLKEIGQRHQLVSLWLSQRNAQSISEGKGEGAGAMGGTVAPAAATTVMQVQRTSNTTLELTLKYGRRTGQGLMSYIVNPSSGLITNPDAQPVGAMT